MKAGAMIVDEHLFRLSEGTDEVQRQSKRRAREGEKKGIGAIKAEQGRSGTRTGGIYTKVTIGTRHSLEKAGGWAARLGSAWHR